MRVLEQMGWDPRRVRMLPSFGPPRRGDARAFGELYVSEVFLKAMESLARYRDQGLPFIAFLYRVARNAAIDRSPQG